MFDTIILLAAEADEPVFASLLRSYNSLLTIKLVVTDADLHALAPDTLVRARLIGFATPVIVPPAVLDRLGYGAYNFHPGSPSYPGWAPAIFAVFDHAREFGATVHRMNDRVDEGDIVGAELFPVPWGSTITGLETLSLAALLRSFGQLACALATQTAPLPALPIRWSGRKCTRREFAAIFDMPLEILAEQFPAAVEQEALSRLNCTAFDFGHEPIPGPAQLAG